MFKLKEFMPGAIVAPEIRPLYNTGTLMDIPSGSYIRTPRGNDLLNGGVGYVFSVVGPGNCFKSDEILFPLFLILKYNKKAQIIIYDTENSMNYPRIIRIAKRCGIEEADLHLHTESARAVLIQAADMLGDHFHEQVRNMRKVKIANRAKLEVKLPWQDQRGNHLTVLPPHFVPHDSLSAFQVSAVQEKIVDKVKIADGKANTQFMKDGAAKTQLIMDFLNLTVSADIFVPMTAHMGKLIEIDQYAPKPSKLAFQSAGKVMKGVPEKFSFINNYILEIKSNKACTQDDGSAKWPKTDSDRKETNDLNTVTAISTRNKSGPSGVMHPYIFSQAEGMLWELIPLDYIREVGKKEGPNGIGFGLQGNIQNYSLCFAPDVKLSRTTARQKLEGNTDLFMRLLMTCHLLQIRNVWRGWEEWWLPPEEIYARCIEQGYDWDKLMNTRWWWVYEEEDDRVGELPEMSAKDLCRIARGLYHPYFLEDDKVSYKKGCFDENGRLTKAGFKKGL